jgi:hypothetical protein
MGTELIEHELSQLHNKTVVVIRPNYGSQSDSWVGYLSVLNGTDYPIRFHFAGAGMAILFTVDDVEKLEEQNGLNSDRSVDKIIRLKGPHDYSESYKTVDA